MAKCTEDSCSSCGASSESKMSEMNELPVIASLSLRTDFWDSHAANMARGCLDVQKDDFDERLWLFRRSFIING